VKRNYSPRLAKIESSSRKPNLKKTELINKTTESNTEEKKKPIIPKKRFTDEAHRLLESGVQEEFTTYCQRISACFNNLDLMPEPDIENGVSSIQLLITSKNRSKIPLSPLLSILTKISMDFKKEIPGTLRNKLVNLVLKVDWNAS